jgi:integrase
VVTSTLQGIRRTLGTAPAQKAPALTDDIRAMIAATDEGLIGLRDRALILLGFAGAFRRSELVALDVSDLTFWPRRARSQPAAQQDRSGRAWGARSVSRMARTRRLAQCGCSKCWLETATLSGGPIFRSLNRDGRVCPGRLAPADVARVVKKLAEVRDWTLRATQGIRYEAGHATAAAISSVSERSIMDQTGHRSVQMVRRYIRDGSLFRDNSAGKLGL